MAPDDLNAPLGQDKKQAAAESAGDRAAAVWPALLGLFGLAVVGWALFVNDPLGGEPVAVVATGRPAPDRPSRTPPATREQQPAMTASRRSSARRRGRSRAAAAAPPPGSQDRHHHRRLERQAPGRRRFPARRRRRAKARRSISSCLETTRHGAIPKIAPDGARPSALYAQPRDVPAEQEGLRRASPSSSAASASAPAAPQTHSRNCRRR